MTLKGQSQGSQILKHYIKCKRAESGHMLLIGKYIIMVSPLVQLHLTLATMKDQCQSDIEGLNLVKEPT